MKTFLFFLGLFSFCIHANAKTPLYIGRDPTWSALDLKEKNANVNLFVNALIEKMNRDNKQPIIITDTGSGSLMTGLFEEKYIAIFTIMSPNLESRNQYDFSDPLLLLGPALVIPAKSDAESLSDLCGKLIGISAFDNSEVILQKYPSILMKQYDNMALALEDLSLGILDAVVMDKIEAQGIISSLYPNKLRVAQTLLHADGIRLMTLKGKNSHFILFFNNKLREFRANSFYDNLLHYSFIK